ncbi:MAG TPA: hypothetical protein VGW10_16675 [Solirubrobacteraceae bacterium]|nr:hypothetical protein [Solirubrobacteraceae bacterium]
MAKVPETARGAYGLRIAGVDARLLVEAPEHWPAMALERHVAAGAAPPPALDAETAVIRLGDRGWAEFERGSRSVRLHTTEEIGDAELVHPFLAPIAATLGWWRGWHPAHAGAFLHDGLAWLVFGGNEAGKSTLLAELALRGHPVVADDLALLTPDGTVMAGPRAIDLRHPGAHERSALEVVRAGSRYRLRLGAVDAEARVGGWFALAWGDGVAVEALEARRRLARFGRRAPHGTDPAVVLALSALPGWRLARPRSPAAIDEALSRMLATATDTAAGLRP